MCGFQRGERIAVWADEAGSGQPHAVEVEIGRARAVQRAISGDREPARVPRYTKHSHPRGIRRLPARARADQKLIRSRAVRDDTLLSLKHISIAAFLRTRGDRADLAARLRLLMRDDHDALA